MKKELFYYFYIDSYDYYDVYKIHLECLRRYINVFNNVNIILSLNDENNIELINIWKERITNYLQYNNDINYIIVHNNPERREGEHFYNLIFKNLEIFDGLIFWGHGKRDFDYDIKFIYKWICGIHYLCSFNINEIEKQLLNYNNKYCISGPFLEAYNYSFNHLLYNCGMYWLYPKKLLQLYKDNINIYNMYADILFYQDQRILNPFMYNFGENWTMDILNKDNMHSFQQSIIFNVHYKLNNIYHNEFDFYCMPLSNIKHNLGNELYDNIVDYYNDIIKTINI